MGDTISTATPTAVPAAPQSTETVSQPNGNSQAGGEATGAQGATVQDTFIPQGVDVSTLPPIIRERIEKINADMVRGFTEKTSKLSETVKSETQKAVEAFKQKAELYDQVAQQEEFVKQWNSYVERVNSQQQQDNPDDPSAKLAQKVQLLEQEVLKGAVGDAIDEFASVTDDKGKPLHGDFDKLNDIIVTEIDMGNGKNQPVSLLKAAIDMSPGNNFHEKIANGYTTAKKVYDMIFEEGRKAGMGRLQSKVLNGTQPPSNANPASIASRRPKNALEALQFAKQGLAVSKD